MNSQDLNRRHFLKISSAAGALMVSLPLKALSQVNEMIAPEIVDGDIGIFVKISADNIITIGSPVPDMGQGVSTSAPIMLADELGADWDHVRIEKLKPHVKQVNENIETDKIRQNAGGSQGVRNVWLPMREAGALARHQIMMAAANRWNVDLTDLKTEKSHVINQVTNERIAYGDLVYDAARTPVPNTLPELKNNTDFTIIGHDIKNEASEKIVRGKPTFGIDMSYPDMRYTMIKRNPYSEGSIRSFNRSEIENMPGISHVLTLDRYPSDPTKEREMSGGVVIVGETFWQVKKAYDSLEIDWIKGPTSHKGNEWLDQEFDKAFTKKNFETMYESGDVEKAFEDAHHTFEAVYEHPYWAHVCMEPHNCIASVYEDKVDIIIGHQTTSRTIGITAEIAGIDYKKVNAKMARMGTGLGRKSNGDFIREAVTISKMIKEPIKLIWTREDEMEQDFFNPKAKHVLKAGLDKDGMLKSMNYTLLCSNNNQIAAHSFPAHCLDHFKAEIAVVEGLQTGPWRGPMENVYGFTNQSFLDELAHMAGQDPYDYQVRLLEGQGQAEYETWDELPVNHDRLLNVLNVVAEKADWKNKKTKKKGFGRGIACHFTFGGYAAWVVDVKVDDDGTVHILKATGVIDCGVAVNPLGIKAQMEGGALDGFSTALFQKVGYKDGKVISNNYDTYKMARIGDLNTDIDVHIIESDIHPTGAGEIGLPPAIPALLNAIFDATGKRIRKLPIADQLA